jgi:GT2 family glycosyltransferase
VRADPARLALLARYGTLPLVDPPADTPTWHALVGANMAVRRAAFEAAGGFDERLGPGAAGLSEDTDLGLRIARATGASIAFVSDAEVHHVLEDERMNDAFHEAYHRRLGRSRYFQKSPTLLGSIAPNLCGAWLRWQVARRCAGEKTAYRERGRWFAYREMLATWREQRERGSAPAERGRGR